MFDNDRHKVWAYCSDQKSSLELKTGGRISLSMVRFDKYMKSENNCLGSLSLNCPFVWIFQWHFVTCLKLQWCFLVWAISSYFISIIIKHPVVLHRWKLLVVWGWHPYAHVNILADILVVTQGLYLMFQKAARTLSIFKIMTSLSFKMWAQRSQTYRKERTHFVWKDLGWS